MRDNKDLFEFNMSWYLGSTDSDRSPNSVPIRQRQGLFMRKGREQLHPWKEGIAIGAEKLKMMLILNHVFSSQSGHHFICFLVIFTSNSLGHNVAIDSVRRLFCPALAFQRFEV